MTHCDYIRRVAPSRLRRCYNGEARAGSRAAFSVSPNAGSLRCTANKPEATSSSLPRQAQAKIASLYSSHSLPSKAFKQLFSQQRKSQMSGRANRACWGSARIMEAALLCSDAEKRMTHMTVTMQCWKRSGDAMMQLAQYEQGEGVGAAMMQAANSCNDAVLMQ